jgi:hypothetical protein
VLTNFLCFIRMKAIINKFKTKTMLNIKKHSTKTKVSSAGLILLLAVQGFLPLLVPTANAATLNKVMVRFDRMLSNTATTGTVCVDPGTTSTDVKDWKVTFPTGYTVSSTASNWETTNISTANLAWPSGAVAWPNATSATAAVSSQTVTWTNASAQTMNTGTTYCYNWTNSAALTVANTSGGAADQTGTVQTRDSSTAQIDSGTYATAVVGTAVGDQITVTASINQTFNFALSANSDGLGTLSASGPSTSPTPRTATVNTNAKNGWQTWAKDSQWGLNSSTASHRIASNCTSSGTGTGSNSTLTNAAEGYNTGVETSQTGGTGSITVATPFVRSSTNYRGGGLCTVLQTLATSDGTANNAVMTLYNSASIVGSTPAASDYGDIITLTAAGLF